MVRKIVMCCLKGSHSPQQFQGRHQSWMRVTSNKASITCHIWTRSWWIVSTIKVQTLTKWANLINLFTTHLLCMTTRMIGHNLWQPIMWIGLTIESSILLWLLMRAQSCRTLTVKSYLHWRMIREGLRVSWRTGQRSISRVFTRSPRVLTTKFLEELI